jgi:geranylgeranyl reductase family protein
MERRDVIIVGGGPAGSATALYLARRDPALARRALILEKARHPRPKVCAGGLIPHTLECLGELGVGLRVPHVMVHRARVAVPGRTVDVEGRELCAVVRRDEFDAALLAAAKAVGTEVREDEKVLALGREAGGLSVTTNRGQYWTPLVIGADGSGSIVRRQLFTESGDAALGRAVMADLPVTDDCRWDGHGRERYDFDFRAVPGGLRGYAWAFPCLIGGAPHVNVGVYARRASGGPDLVRLLRGAQAELGIAGVRHQAAPIRCHTPASFTARNVMLVGDAAGAEPLMGEGISFAFEYGRWAAAEVAAAVERDAFHLVGAEARFRRSWVGRKLRRLDQAATMFYGPGARLWLAIAARWRGAQRIGLDWYNGVNGWDRRSGLEALRAALSRSAAAEAALAPR